MFVNKGVGDSDGWLRNTTSGFWSLIGHIYQICLQIHKTIKLLGESLDLLCQYICIYKTHIL